MKVTHPCLPEVTLRDGEEPLDLGRRGCSRARGWSADGETERHGEGETRREGEGEKGRIGRIMTPEWNGIERRLKRLKGCSLKLELLKTKTSDEFASDPYLKDIVERNLEGAAQACIDIANRIISMEQLAKPRVLERREQSLPLVTELKV